MSADRIFHPPAFPVPGMTHDTDFRGLTKREYFAALAMQSLIESGRSRLFDGVAKDAVVMADALLMELGG